MRSYRVTIGTVFYNQNNGYRYEIIGKGDALYEVIISYDDENGDVDPCSITTGHITEQELRKLIKDETGLNFMIEWEEEERCC